MRFQNTPLRSFLLVLFGLLFARGMGQDLCRVQVLYERSVHVERYVEGETKLLIRRVDSLVGRGCAVQAWNANLGYFQYLASHFTQGIDDARLLLIPDSLRLQRAYRKALRQDSTFDALMEEYNAKALAHSQPKDSISTKVMLDFAVKYFSIRKITPEGHYAVKICAGLNDILKTEPLRRPHLEAFCFSAILKHAHGSTYPLMAEMTKAVRELYTLNMGIDLEERLLRAQGALYILMRNNPVLLAMLQAEYAARAEYLPFVWLP